MTATNFCHFELFFFSLGKHSSLQFQLIGAEILQCDMPFALGITCQGPCPCLSAHHHSVASHLPLEQPPGEKTEHIGDVLWAAMLAALLFCREQRGSCTQSHHWLCSIEQKSQNTAAAKLLAVSLFVAVGAPEHLCSCGPEPPYSPGSLRWSWPIHRCTCHALTGYCCYDQHFQQ